jgi:hypothetical protein
MQMLGHDGPPQAFWTENLITGAPLERCPLRAIQLARETDPAIAHEVDRYAATYYPLYRDGHLLVEGGIADQPARYLELLGVMRDIDHEMERKAAELLAPKTGEES